MPITKPIHWPGSTEKIIPKAIITKIPRNTSIFAMGFFFAMGSKMEVQKVWVERPARHMATVETLAAPKNNNQ